MRDNIAMFGDARVRLLGISVDSVHSLRAWATQEDYEFSIVSDFWPHGEVSKKYGAFVEEKGFATRATVLIGEGRKVLASFETEPGVSRDLSAYRAALALA